MGKTRTRPGWPLTPPCAAAAAGVYRLRLIHGYHGGTALRDLCREYAGHPRVLRLVASPGSTDLVLREF